MKKKMTGHTIHDRTRKDEITDGSNPLLPAGTIRRQNPIRRMETILDSYGNPAIVTSVGEHTIGFVMLTGSDFGRSGSRSRKDVERQRHLQPVTEAQVAWARRRWSELRSR